MSTEHVNVGEGVPGLCSVPRHVHGVSSILQILPPKAFVKFMYQPSVAQIVSNSTNSLVLSLRDNWLQGKTSGELLINSEEWRDYALIG